MSRKKERKRYSKPPSERALITYKGKPISWKFWVQVFLPALSLLLAHFAFKSDLGTFASIMILFPIFSALRLDGRYLIGYGIGMLALAAILLGITGNASDNSPANLAAIYAYWLLFAGVLTEIVNYVRDRRKEAREVGKRDQDLV